MTTEQFWDIIAASRSGWKPRKAEGNMDRQLARLKQLLSALAPDEILAFAKHYTHYHLAAYHWDLWAAAYLYEGGCSDDGFTDFRNWLISMGKDIYEAALQDPDSLAAVYARSDIEYNQFEEFGYVARQAYEAKTGGELPPTGLQHPKEPAGQPWHNGPDEDAELARRLPKVYARYEANDD